MIKWSIHIFLEMCQVVIYHFELLSGYIFSVNIILYAFVIKATIVTIGSLENKNHHSFIWNVYINDGIKHSLKYF